MRDFRNSPTLGQKEDTISSDLLDYFVISIIQVEQSHTSLEEQASQILHEFPVHPYFVRSTSSPWMNKL
jgi:hypothetical protein